MRYPDWCTIREHPGGADKKLGLRWPKLVEGSKVFHMKITVGRLRTLFASCGLPEQVVSDNCT